MRLMSRAALALAATLLAPAALHAQTSLGIAGGLAMPTGDASDLVKSGYNLTVALGIKPPVAPIGLRIDGMWNSLDSKTAGGNALRVLGGNANVTLSGPMLPLGYLIGGVGMYNFSSEGTESETKMGFNAGVGINFPLTGFSTFVEARYHHVQTEGSSFQFVPVTFGIRF
jgi:outer membrane protein with beta-barrel domain